MDNEAKRNKWKRIMMICVVFFLGIILFRFFDILGLFFVVFVVPSIWKGIDRTRLRKSLLYLFALACIYFGDLLLKQYESIFELFAGLIWSMLFFQYVGYWAMEDQTGLGERRMATRRWSFMRRRKEHRE